MPMQSSPTTCSMFLNLLPASRSFLNTRREFSSWKSIQGSSCGLLGSLCFFRSSSKAMENSRLAISDYWSKQIARAQKVVNHAWGLLPAKLELTVCSQKAAGFPSQRANPLSRNCMVSGEVPGGAFDVVGLVVPCALNTMFLEHPWNSCGRTRFSS